MSECSDCIEVIFLFWDNFRLTEKLERLLRELLSTLHSVSPNVNILHNCGTSVKTEIDIAALLLSKLQTLLNLPVFPMICFLFQDPTLLVVIMSH